MTPTPTVAMLVAAHRLERVPADREAALSRLRRAEEKLAVARKIADLDIDVSYVTAYDAARIAISALMLSHGYRVRAVAGAHEATGYYAEAALDVASVREFQRMRRRRNKSEYDDAPIGRSELSADLEHADAIVRAVAHQLPG